MAASLDICAKLSAAQQLSRSKLRTLPLTVPALAVSSFAGLDRSGSISNTHEADLRFHTRQEIVSPTSVKDFLDL